MIRTTRMTCILCPRGCTLTVLSGEGAVQVAGNACPKGEVYADNEITCPMRILTTTVKTAFADRPRLSVRTNKEVPLKDVFSLMEAANRVVCAKRVKTGDTVAKNLGGFGADLVATDDMDDASS